MLLQYQVLLPFYLLDFLKLSDTSITIVPLVLYLAQFVSTFSIKALSRASGRKGALTLGALLVLGACAAFWFLEPSNASYVYPAIVRKEIFAKTTMPFMKPLSQFLPILPYSFKIRRYI